MIVVVCWVLGAGSSFDVDVDYCVCQVGHLMLMIDGLWEKDFSIQ